MSCRTFTSPSDARPDCRASALSIVVFCFRRWSRPPRQRRLERLGQPGDQSTLRRRRIRVEDQGWCDTNCSFVSGEASSAMWLVAVALVLPGRIRRPAVVVAVAYAALLSLNRIAFGGHFLSDVLISFALTLLVIAVVYRLVILRPPRWLENATLEAGLARIGHALRGGRTGTA
jgi:membrane-associated phospholipid phosphatase